MTQPIDLTPSEPAPEELRIRGFTRIDDTRFGWKHSRGAEEKIFALIAEGKLSNLASFIDKPMTREQNVELLTTVAQRHGIPGAGGTQLASDPWDTWSEASSYEIRSGHHESTEDPPQAEVEVEVDPNVFATYGLPAGRDVIQVDLGPPSTQFPGSQTVGRVRIDGAGPRGWQVENSPGSSSTAKGLSGFADSADPARLWGDWERGLNALRAASAHDGIVLRNVVVDFVKAGPQERPIGTVMVGELGDSLVAAEVPGAVKQSDRAMLDLAGAVSRLRVEAERTASTARPGAVSTAAGVRSTAAMRGATSSGSKPATPDPKSDRKKLRK